MWGGSCASGSLVRLAWDDLTQHFDLGSDAARSKIVGDVNRMVGGEHVFDDGDHLDRKPRERRNQSQTDRVMQGAIDGRGTNGSVSRIATTGRIAPSGPLALREANVSLTKLQGCRATLS